MTSDTRTELELEFDRTLADLRPAHRPLDPAWSEEVLASILTAPTVLEPARVPARRPRRAPRALAALAAAAAIAVGAVVAAPGPQPAASALAAAHLAAHPEVRAGEYLHIRRDQRLWGPAGDGVADPLGIEYWIPGDPREPWRERSTFQGRTSVLRIDGRDPESGDGDPHLVRALYADDVPATPVLRERLLAHAADQGYGRDLSGLTQVAWWVLNDALAPQRLKDGVTRVLRAEPGVAVVDPDVRILDLRGTALAASSDPVLWYVVDPATSAFRGLVGHPAPAPGDAPAPTMWTITFPTEVVDRAP